MFVETVPKEDWASFAPPEKTPFQLIMELYGSEDTISITRLLGEIVEKENSEVVFFRPDLSYEPGDSN
jgi:hypothetical protein